MKKPSFSPILLAIFLFLLILLIPKAWIVAMIPKERVETAATSLNPLMFQGEYIQSSMLKDEQYLPIYGSSELSRMDRFHPYSYFKVNNQGFTPFLVGRGGNQSLTHFLNFSTQSEQLKGKKIVFILSAQWFTKEGTDESHFAPNFSTLQGYNLYFNSHINPNLKKQAMKRLQDFDIVNKDKMLSILYQSETTNDPRLKWQAKVIRPAASLYKDSLEKKDLYFAWSGIEYQRKREISSEVKDQSWTELDKQAERVGEERSNSNSYKISNDYYRKIQNDLPRLKNIRKGYTYRESVEYHDFQLMLDVLKESGANPLFVIVPVHGEWYDYLGFPKEGRSIYYTKIRKQVEAQGFQVADFSNHEYNPYFLKDPLHLGWKGWVHVDQSIQQFMSQ